MVIHGDRYFLSGNGWHFPAVNAFLFAEMDGRFQRESVHDGVGTVTSSENGSHDGKGGGHVTMTQRETTDIFVSFGGKGVGNGERFSRGRTQQILLTVLTGRGRRS